MVPVVACSCGHLARSGEFIDEIAYLSCTKPCEALQIFLSHRLASRPIREAHRASLTRLQCRISVFIGIPPDTLSSSTVGKNMTETGQESKSQDKSPKTRMAPFMRPDPVAARKRGAMPTCRDPLREKLLPLQSGAQRSSSYFPSK